MKPARILVVEDNDDARTMFGIMLRSWGYNVIEAANGGEGLAAARKERPDLILLDVMMPDMDGYAVCRELRQDAQFKAIPIIFLTALDGVDDQIEAFTIGGDDFLTKSKLDYNTLGVRIQAALARTQRIQEATVERIRRGTTVGMLSLRGGVGVSTLALNLSYQAALHQEQPTILIDMSFPVGSIGLWSGIIGPKHVVELLSRHPAEIDLPLIKNFCVQNIHGFQLIPAPSTLTDIGRIRMQAVEKVIHVLQDAGYFIVLDLGRAALPLQWQVPSHCDWTLIITSDDSTSRALARVALDGLPELGVDSRSLLMILNDVGNVKPKDVRRGLPRSPDVIIPYRADLPQFPAASPVADLWSIISRKAEAEKAS